MGPDGGRVWNLVSLHSRGTSHIIKPIIVKKVLMDPWKWRGHKKILPIVTKDFLLTVVRDSNTRVEMAMCDCLVVRQHWSRPEETDDNVALITDLRNGDKTVLVTCRHNKLRLVLSAAWRLLSHIRHSEQRLNSSNVRFWHWSVRKEKIILWSKD